MRIVSAIIAGMLIPTIATADDAGAPAVDPICYAAADRLTRATMDAALADPVIVARSKRTPPESEIKEMVRSLADKLAADDAGVFCAIALGLPDTSMQGLARSFTEKIRRDSGRIPGSNPHPD